MNTWMQITFAIVLAVVLILSACAPAATPPAAAPPATAPQQAPAQPAPAKPLPIAPLIASDLKPSLPELPDLSSSKCSSLVDRSVLNHMLGFSAPDGALLMKVGALEEPVQSKDKDNLWFIGVVQVRQKTLGEYSTYVAGVDLNGTKGTVAGQVIDCSTGLPQDVPFVAFPQQENPDRKDFQQRMKIDSPVRNIYPSIAANTFCMLVTPQPGTKMDQAVRYCLGAEPTQRTDPIKNTDYGYLSVKGSFPDRYAGLNERMTTAFRTLQGSKYIPSGATLFLDGTTSEMENPERIRKCSVKQESCMADIVAAPLSQPAPFKSDEGSGLVVGVINVMQEIQVRGKNVPAGDYAVRYYYSPGTNGDQFDGATLINDMGVEFQIPAVPAAYIDADPQQPGVIGTQISSMRLFGCCLFWQNSCS